jgi:hypothetical protein
MIRGKVRVKENTNTKSLLKGFGYCVFMCVFIITDKEKLVGEEVKDVGVMKDEELQLEEIETSHTQNLNRVLLVYSQQNKKR